MDEMDKKEVIMWAVESAAVAIALGVWYDVFGSLHDFLCRKMFGD